LPRFATTLVASIVDINPNESVGKMAKLSEHGLEYNL
jgi:hypothetical protein